MPENKGQHKKSACHSMINPRDKGATCMLCALHCNDISDQNISLLC